MILKEKFIELISSYYLKFKYYKKEFTWVILAQLVGFTGSVIGIKLLTTTLGPKGYGELALGMTVAIVLNQIFFGPFGGVVSRYYSIYRDDRQLELFYSALK